MNEEKMIEMVKAFIEMLRADESRNSSGEPEKKPMEMLSIKECAVRYSGLSEYTVRNLVRQGKVKSVRAGTGGRGKYLVNSESLYSYLSGQSEPGSMN